MERRHEKVDRNRPCHNEHGYALAQYYETGNRSGYWAPGRVVTTAPARVHSRARYLGEQSYAMSPRGNIYGGYFNYGDTGGGSPGYNQLLMTW
jgi:hypothetical protein